MTDPYDQFFADYDQRRALASISRAAMRRHACGARGWVVIWPHIPPTYVAAPAHGAPRA